VAHARSHKRKKAPKRVLALPDLEHAKSAVLNCLTSRSGQRTYDHAIREFVAWYCSEPRPAFNRTVVLRYRIHLEQRQYAPATINLRLAAVRRVAYEAADAGLLSPELAAGIRRVKGVRRASVSVSATGSRPIRVDDCSITRSSSHLERRVTMPCWRCSSAAAYAAASC
jgi:hypothetical protein